MESTNANEKKKHNNINWESHQNFVNWKGWHFYFLNLIGQIGVSNSGKYVEVHADWKL